MTTEQDELLARLDKYGAQRAKLAERLKDRMEPEWNHFLDAAAAICDLTAKLEAERKANACPIGLDATPEICSASSCRHCLAEKVKYERTAREEAEQRLERESYWADFHEQRATAAEQRLAAAFEETRERCAKVCEEERLSPDDEEYDNKVSVSVGEGTYANLMIDRCIKAIRALAPEGTAAPQASGESEHVKASANPASAAATLGEHVARVELGYAEKNLEAKESK